ncbi:MAG: hypothetical protein R3C62_06685 [Chloroflexota bacterium]
MADEWRPDEVELPTRMAPEGAKGCLWRLLALLLVVSLLGSAWASLVWLWRLRQPLPMPTPDNSPVVLVVTPTAVFPTSVPTAAIPTTPLAETAVPAPNPNRIDRIVFINGDNQIETVAPDGSAVRRLTNGSLSFRFPAWSPDGRYIAAIGNGRLSSGIYVVADSADPVEPTALYTDNRSSPIYLSWSPDSEQVGFITPGVGRDLALHLAPADGASESRELATGSPFYWRWGGDGSQILFSTSDLVGLLTVANGRQEVLATSGRFQAPDISPDGRFWAYATANRFRRNAQLVLHNTITSERTTTAHAGLVAMGWSPTANQLAYISPAQESSFFYGALRLLDAESGRSRVLSDDTVLAFFWSPNGRYLAYISIPESPADRQQAASNGRLLGKPVQQHANLRLNLSLVDVTTDTGLALLQFQPTPLFLNQFLPFFDQYAHSHQLWSPDSDALVLPLEENGVAQIVVVPATGGRVFPLAEGSIAFWSGQ